MCMALDHFVNTSFQDIRGTSYHHYDCLDQPLNLYLASISTVLVGSLTQQIIQLRAANLVQQTVSSHHSGKGYRDGTISTKTLPLKKKYTVKARVNDAFICQLLFDIVNLYAVSKVYHADSVLWLMQSVFQMQSFTFVMIRIPQS